MLCPHSAEPLLSRGAIRQKSPFFVSFFGEAKKEKRRRSSLDKYQMKELISLVEEPAEKDTISEEEFRKLFARWGTK